MLHPFIQHHGALEGVTGSCHQLFLGEKHSVLIDCGLFQGEEQSARGVDGRDGLGIEFALETVKALIVTHVHIDHVGRIPYLLAAGFSGPILCSEPSAKLLPVVLEDAFKLGVSRDQVAVERYIRHVNQRIIALPYKTWFTLIDDEALNCRVRLQRAGHVLGSAYVEVDVLERANAKSTRVVFSGDLGAPHSPFLSAPRSPSRADIVVLESTYGDRLHKGRKGRREQLERLVIQALADQGTVLIPAFSIGRTQELLYELEDILHTKRTQAASGLPSEVPAAVDWHNLPIILDSPLAGRFTQIYRELEHFWNAEAVARRHRGRQPLAFDNLITVDTHASHTAMVNRLTHTAQAAIVIAGNGMCSGGRIVNYLKAMLGDPRHNVVFVGYQAIGTPGRQIQQYGPNGGYVDYDGQRYQIRAPIHTLSGYSAHADQAGLVNFVAGMRCPPQEIRLVHGEPGAKKALAEKLSDHFRLKGQMCSVVVPDGSTQSSNSGTVAI